MLAVRLVQLIESHIEQLSRELSEKAWNAPQCSDLHKVPASELEARTREIYRNLCDWMLDKAETQVERRYTELGAAAPSRAWPTATSSGPSPPPSSTCATSFSAKVCPITPWNCAGSWSCCTWPASSSIRAVLHRRGLRARARPHRREARRRKGEDEQRKST